MKNKGRKSPSGYCSIGMFLFSLVVVTAVVLFCILHLGQERLSSLSTFTSIGRKFDPLSSSLRSQVLESRSPTPTVRPTTLGMPVERRSAVPSMERSAVKHDSPVPSSEAPKDIKGSQSKVQSTQKQQADGSKGRTTNQKNNIVSSNNNNRSVKKKPKRYAGLQVLNVDPDWGANGEYPWIEVLPTKKKIPIKKDRRVVFRDKNFEPFTRSPGPRSTELGRSRDLQHAEAQLRKHLFFAEPQLADGSTALVTAMQRLYTHCQGPLFLGMATVHDDLYWQLIENFFYSAVRFEVDACAVMICISDPACLRLCRDASFPCFNYTSEGVVNSGRSGAQAVPVMEQIAQVKLLWVPQALALGVSVFMLDLDVGFLQSPRHLLQPFRDTPVVDIMVQEDMIFIMNRSVSGWKSWFTEPLPNIGLFLTRGNNRTQKVFDIAWDKYRDMDDDYAKRQPGKDQNHVLDAMRIARGTAALKYAYYDAYTAPLLDKLVLRHGTVLELGGEVLAQQLRRQGAVAVHATCYEQSTKVHGLRAAGAFWNPRRYDALQRTLTKPLLFTDEESLLQELRALVYLAMLSDRRLIVPNLLGDPDPYSLDPRRLPDLARVALFDPQTQRPVYAPDSLGRGQWDSSAALGADTSSEVLDEAQWGARTSRGSFPAQRLWPGFRVLFLKRSRGRNDLDLQLLEPGFYWRVARDYDAPENATILWFDAQTQDLLQLRDQLLAPDIHTQARVILASDAPRSTSSDTSSEAFRARWAQLLRQWADDSVGAWPVPYASLLREYGRLPGVKDVRQRGDARHRALVDDILQGLRLCKNVFHPPIGNRTCFQVCD